MSAEVVYLPEAAADVDQTYAHYEGCRVGLGERFLQHLQEGVQAVSDNPLMYAILRDDVRAAPLKRFPYVIYYRIEGNAVIIKAVLHGHRNPQVWMRR